MKSLLVLLAAAAAVIPLMALGQIEAPAGPATAPPTAPYPAPAPPAASSSPAPAAPSAPAPAGNAHDAAATVPLPGQGSGPALEKNIPLIPENAPDNGKGPRHSGRSHPGASPHEFATFQTEDDIRLRLRMRRAQTEALGDPVVQADWVAAHQTNSDPERRTFLAAYYNHLFDRMIKIDPTIKERVNARRDSALIRMKYTRLGEEDNSENPFVAPAQAPSGPNPPVNEATTQPGG